MPDSRMDHRLQCCRPVVGAKVIAAAIFAAPFVLIVGLLIRDWVNARRDEMLFDEDDEEEIEFWQCSDCGFNVGSTTIEGIVEGMRIHDVAIYCPGDEDDEEGHY